MSDASSPRHRRPAYLDPSSMDDFAVDHLDPALQTQLAHESARVMVHAGRARCDPELTDKLVHLVEEIGLTSVAALWSKQAARSLPGALWRLYAIREWVRRHPAEAAVDFERGLPFAEVEGAVAGVESPPGPTEVCQVVDAILCGLFTGDLGVALHRAGAFCQVVAAGRAAHEPDPPADGTDAAEHSERHARRAAAMAATGEDLHACGRLWQLDTLS